MCEYSEMGILERVRLEAGQGDSRVRLALQMEPRRDAQGNICVREPFPFEIQDGVCPQNITSFQSLLVFWVILGFLKLSC